MLIEQEMALIAPSLGLQYEKEIKIRFISKNDCYRYYTRITITHQEESRCTISANTRRDAETDKDLLTPIK